MSTVATLVDLGNFPIVQSFEDNDNTAWAVFGQAEYDISDAFEVSVSIRYDEDEREQNRCGNGR